MQNDRKLTRDRNLGLAKPVALGEPDPPGFHRGPSDERPLRAKKRTAAKRLRLNALDHSDRPIGGI